MIFKEKLNVMFKELRKKGYCARQNFMCCQGCGFSAMSARGIKEKAVFYHRQDAECIVHEYVYLSWDGDALDIIAAAHKANLAVQWDGSEGKRIKVVNPKGADK